MPDRTEQTGLGAGRLPRARLAPAGAARLDAATWAGRIALGALAVALLAVAFNTLRPLPSPPPVAAERPDAIPDPPIAQRSLDERESLLARLNNSGNIFAPDRQMWERAVAMDDDAAEHEETEDHPASATQTAQSSHTRPENAGSDDDTTRSFSFDDIPLAEHVPVNVDKELKNLRLRGVYSTPSGPIAMIGTLDARHPDERKRSYAYQPGDSFDDDKWRVLAIDTEGKRVFLARAGLNMALRMFDDVPIESSRRVASRRRAEPLPPPSVVVHTRTPDQLRRELREAGYGSEEIEDLLALTEREDLLDASPAPAVAAAPESELSSDAIPDAPEGFADLIRMMSSNEAPGGRNVPPQLQRKDSDQNDDE